ncbi:hypothetical protein UlMin_017212 [Ulmus minor]
MASVIGFRVPPFLVLNSENRPQFVLSSNLTLVNGASVVGERKTLIDNRNGKSKTEVEKKKSVKDDIPEKLEPMWDDGYGTEIVKDYFDAMKEMIKPDGRPPRWFSPISCGRPQKDSPILLFFSGMDSTGMGLILYHKALGKFFEVRCLHIPISDQTPFEGFVKLVEETIRFEHASSPNKPIYLLQPFFPLLEAMLDALHITVPYLLSYLMGDPRKMAMVDVGNRLPPMKRLEKMFQNLTDLLPCLSRWWKLLFINCGQDNMNPSKDEAQRLNNSLKNCTIRLFKDNGHTFLLEDGFSLMTVVKGTSKYRCTRRFDFISDFLPPSKQEAIYAFDEVTGCLSVRFNLYNKWELMVPIILQFIYLLVALTYHEIFNCRNNPLQFSAHCGASVIHRLQLILRHGKELGHSSLCSKLRGPDLCTHCSQVQENANKFLDLEDEKTILYRENCNLLERFSTVETTPLPEL